LEDLGTGLTGPRRDTGYEHLRVNAAEVDHDRNDDLAFGEVGRDRAALRRVLPARRRA
jgi:hypothetical protein